MKKIILSAIAGAAISFSAFATGVIGPNQPQAGSSTFTSATGLIVTNTFPYVYTSIPIVQLAGASTNNGPFTATSVTVSNFVLTVLTGTTTNNTITWNSYIGYPRVLYGTNAVTGGTPVTNSFNPAYAYPPIVIVSGDTLGVDTNGNFPAITSVTVSAFIMKSGKTQNVFWQSIGPAYTPGANTVTY